MRTHSVRIGSLVATMALGVAALPVSAQTNGYVLQCLSARTSGQGCG